MHTYIHTYIHKMNLERNKFWVKIARKPAFRAKDRLFLCVYTFMESSSPISSCACVHLRVSPTTTPGLSRRTMSNRGPSVILWQGKRPTQRASCRSIQGTRSSLWNHSRLCLHPKLTLCLAKFNPFHIWVHHSPSWWLDRARRREVMSEGICLQRWPPSFGEDGPKKGVAGKVD